MIEVSKDDRYALRNECMLLVGFRFGLRVSELLSLHVRDIDLKDERIHIEAAKDLLDIFGFCLVVCRAARHQTNSL
jgi:integrase